MSLYCGNERCDIDSEEDIVLKVSKACDAFSGQCAATVVRAHEFAEIGGRDLDHPLQEPTLVGFGPSELPDRFPLLMTLPPVGEVEQIDSEQVVV